MSRKMPALLTTPSSRPKWSVGLDDLAGGNGFRHRLEVGDRGSAALLDFLHHFLGGRRARSGAIGTAAGIVDDDLRALGGAQQRDLAPDTAARAGDDDDFVLQ
jgi:hypothetical protein